MDPDFDDLANRILTRLPDGPELVVIGSTSFWHADSEATCVAVGRLLADVPDLLLVTGGVEGVGETVGRSFFLARTQAGREPRVYHLLPHGEEAWDYGETFFAGRDMAERREVLTRLARVYLAIEGAPAPSTRPASPSRATPSWCPSDDPAATPANSTRKSSARGRSTPRPGRPSETSRPARTRSRRPRFVRFGPCSDRASLVRLTLSHKATGRERCRCSTTSMPHTPRSGRGNRSTADASGTN